MCMYIPSICVRVLHGICSKVTFVCVCVFLILCIHMHKIAFWLTHACLLANECFKWMFTCKFKYILHAHIVDTCMHEFLLHSDPELLSVHQSSPRQRHIPLHVDMYVCMYVFVHVCTYVCLKCMCVCMHMFVCVHYSTSLCVCLHMSMHTGMQLSAYLCTNLMFIYVCDTYIHKHTNIQI